MKAATTTGRRRRPHLARTARPASRPRRRARPLLWREADDGPDPVIQDLIARAARGESFRVQVF
jgi:hypothetical protein